VLKLFRATAILEGISYLLLFGITMPLKYWADIFEPNKIVGYAHGVLFMVYVAMAVVFCWRHKWGLKQFTILFMASLLPFATFYVEEKYLRNLSQ